MGRRHARSIGKFGERPTAAEPLSSDGLPGRALRRAPAPRAAGGDMADRCGVGDISLQVNAGTLIGGSSDPDSCRPEVGALILSTIARSRGQGSVAMGDQTTARASIPTRAPKAFGSSGKLSCMTPGAGWRPEGTSRARPWGHERDVGDQPSEPSISSFTRRLNSMAYSIGSSFVNTSRKPWMTRFWASFSVRPRLIR